MRKRSQGKRSSNRIWLALFVVGIAVGGTLLYRAKSSHSVKPLVSSSSQPTSSIAEVTQSSIQDQTTESESSADASSVVTSTSTSTSIQSSEMQSSQILTGDLSSLTGTWVNSRGYRLTFHPSGLVESDGQITDLVSYADGIVKGFITFPDGIGATIYFIPKGIEFSVFTTSEDTIPFADASDHTVDRILIGQHKAALNDSENFYYKQ